MSAPSSHLSLVLDLSPTEWSASEQPINDYPLPFHDFLTHTLAFMNSHMACAHENSLAVFGALPGKSQMFYSSIDEPNAADGDLADENSYQPFRTMNSVVAKRIAEAFDDLGSADVKEPVAVVAALTKALCCSCLLTILDGEVLLYPNTDINRVASENDRPKTSANNNDSTPNTPPESRILILSVSPDLSMSYIPLMNCIFSAQKLKVLVDVCKVYGPDTVFLQQAAHLTGGSYLCLERRDALLQYLTMTFLPPSSVRNVLSVPTQDRIDYRAACFCHKNVVDIGYVCSVCLSIFCAPVPVCSTCRTKFPIKALQRLNALRAPLLPPTKPPQQSANGYANHTNGG